MTKYLINYTSKDICTKWWSEKWCEYLYYCFPDKPKVKFSQAKTFLRKGQIINLSINIRFGEVVADLVYYNYENKIVDSYGIKIIFKPFSQEEKVILTDIIEKNVIDFNNNIVPKKLEYIYSRSSDGIFPNRDKVKFFGYYKGCLAVMYAISSIMDGDPLIIFKLRGIDVNRIIENYYKNIENTSWYCCDYQKNSNNTEEISNLFNIKVEDFNFQINGQDNLQENNDLIKVTIGKKEKTTFSVPKSNEPKKYVLQYDMQGNFINKYYTYVEAAKATLLDPQRVRLACIGEIKFAGNYQWKIIDPNQDIPLSISSEINQKIYRPGRAVLQMDNDGKIINEFCSISEASDTIGVGYDSIKGVLQKKQKHAGGYCWQYKDIYEQNLKQSFREQNLCQYCGGKFKKRFFGLLKPICQNCGKKKDYKN